ATASGQPGAGAFLQTDTLQRTLSNNAGTLAWSEERHVETTFVTTDGFNTEDDSWSIHTDGSGNASSGGYTQRARLGESVAAGMDLSGAGTNNDLSRQESEAAVQERAGNVVAGEFVLTEQSQDSIANSAPLTLDGETASLAAAGTRIITQEMLDVGGV